MKVTVRTIGTENNIEAVEVDSIHFAPNVQVGHIGLRENTDDIVEVTVWCDFTLDHSDMANGYLNVLERP